MLIDFSVTNYRSFRDETTFDMRPAKSKKLGLDETNIANVKLADGKTMPVLRTSAIYGANASGKSNFIKALTAMDEIIRADAGRNALEKYIEPFALSKKTINKPTIFEITIIADDDVTYEFGFSATSDIVHKEWLYGYPQGRKKTYYERNLVDVKKEKYEYINRLTGDKKVWERVTTPQRLFLSTAIQLNCQELKPIYNWFADKICVIEPKELSKIFSINHCLSEKGKEEVIGFLRDADISFNDIEIKNVFVNGEQSKKAFMVHETLEGDVTIFELEDESDGTQKIFALAAPVLDAIKQGQIFIIDELDNSLHSLLARHIVRSFHKKGSQAQLILSSHDSSLLNADELLRRDQIWFCEKKQDAISELYPLAEFKIRSEIKNLEYAYLVGSYGGTPFIPDTFLGT